MRLALRHHPTLKHDSLDVLYHHHCPPPLKYNHQHAQPTVSCVTPRAHPTITAWRSPHRTHPVPSHGDWSGHNGPHCEHCPDPLRGLGALALGSMHRVAWRGSLSTTPHGHQSAGRAHASCATTRTQPTLKLNPHALRCPTRSHHTQARSSQMPARHSRSMPCSTPCCHVYALCSSTSQVCLALFHALTPHSHRTQAGCAPHTASPFRHLCHPLPPPTPARTACGFALPSPLPPSTSSVLSLSRTILPVQTSPFPRHCLLPPKPRGWTTSSLMRCIARGFTLPLPLPPSTSSNA
jgi:hypothetical protein